MTTPPDHEFRARYWQVERPRPDDERDPYQRDKARVIHASAFRRLQAKTQVMGVGEGDFHRTRLTHSLEAAQIAEGVLGVLARDHAGIPEIAAWLPTRDLLAYACLCHDLGHPPFGHGGEIALHRRMAGHGGFEANAQTLRIITRLEKYLPNRGMNPTRRSILAILKYPAPYSSFDAGGAGAQPPKCYYDSEAAIVDWVLSGVFTRHEASAFRAGKSADGRSLHKSFDCSIMNFADDVAYAVHDLEDIVARRMVERDAVVDRVEAFYAGYGNRIGGPEKAVSIDEFRDDLFGESSRRKRLIGKMVNLFVTSARVVQKEGFDHPLLKYGVGCDEAVRALLEGLKHLTNDLVIQRPTIQRQVERGQEIIDRLFRELMQRPAELIPGPAGDSDRGGDSAERRVCDYIAGMTDTYAEKRHAELVGGGG